MLEGRSRHHLTDLSIYWRQLWEGTHDYFPTIRFVIGHLDLTIINFFQRSLSIFKFLPPYFSLLPLTHLHLNLACHKEKNNPVISHHLLIFCEFLTLQGLIVKKLWVEKQTPVSCCGRPVIWLNPPPWKQNKNYQNI